MVTAAGFVDPRLESHGFVRIADAEYMVSIAEREQTHWRRTSASAASWLTP